MAVYESRLTDARGYEEVSDYLWDLNERIKYYFMALTPDDNFTEEAYQQYLQKGKDLLILEETKEGLQTTIASLENSTNSQLSLFSDRISLCVNKGEVSAQLNIEPDSIDIKGDRLQIIGDTLNLNTNGDLKFEGEVIAESGEIGGWYIAGGEGQKYLGGSNDSRITVDSLESEEDLSFHDVAVHGASDLSGSEISLVGAIVETDKSTIFEGGFSGVSMDCHTYPVVCGAARAYEEITAHGQITCRTCYTSADGSTWSDRRLKKDIKDLSLEESEEILSHADPYSYDRIDIEKHQVGFIAQDLILSDPDGEYGLTSERDGKYTVSYKALIPFLIKELQQQTREIDILYGGAA